jgi:guanylate kinase
MSLAPLIVISGPSGSGKSTLIRRLLADSATPLRLSVSATTRPRRPKERDGIDYHYWTREQFEQEIAAGGFLEWADVFGSYYGTLRREVEPFREQGRGVILDIDVQGWRQVRSRCPDVVSIFIRTPTLAELEKRLRERGTEDEAAMQRRLRGAEAELACADQYDYQVVNDDKEAAAARLLSIVDGLARRPARSCH